jgi:hypothetical protein
MRSKGFSFACPTLVNDKDEVFQFQKLLNVPKTDYSKIHNPFPQIAYSDNYNQACTNPLLYLWYRPTIDSRQIQDPLKSVLTQFYNPLTFGHEFIHLALADTPAKRYARFILANAYGHLHYMFIPERWYEDIWDELELANKELKAICEAITLSEELLALALSVNNMVSSIPQYWHRYAENDGQDEERVKVSQTVMEILEEKSINEYQKLFPTSDIAELYYNSFKKIAAWNKLNNLVLHQVSWYLQGIQSKKPWYEVVDSHSRCKSLAEKVKGMENEAGLEDWITEAVSDHEITSSLLALGLLIAPLKLSGKEELTRGQRSWFEFTGKMGSCLWTLWQGSRPPIENQTISEVLSTTTLKPPSILIHLIPQESDKGWFIVPRIDNRHKGTRAQRQAVKVLLPLESLRQQLDERKGFYCPNYQPGKCNCESTWREKLWRVLQWAREGRFGDGEWRDLPAECIHGT